MAVARKKADVERMDLYRIDESSSAATPRVIPLGRVVTGKRGFKWVVGKQHFAYLRKLKGFGRGGNALEIYPIGVGL